MSKSGTEQPKKNELQVVSARFVSEVERQFAAEMGSALKFTDYEKTLAQHMFLKVDAQLKALEDKRLDNPNGNDLPIKWENVNMQKLALDAVHRIGLGLDALVPNHIHPIPYKNKRTNKYDLDLRIGYVGKDYCRRKLAVEEPVEVIYQLVYDTDTFKPKMRSATNELESYEFEINNPFKRGKVIGGFGYIIYDDHRKNRLVMVTERDFKKAESGSRNKDFWGDEKWREEMMFKTIVHRVADKLPLDPKKVNAKSYAYVEAQEAERDISEEMGEKANKDAIDIEANVVDESASSDVPAAADQAAATQESAPAAAAPAGKPQQTTLGPKY